MIGDFLARLNVFLFSGAAPRMILCQNHPLPWNLAQGGRVHGEGLQGRHQLQHHLIEDGNGVLQLVVAIESVGAIDLLQRQASGEQMLRQGLPPCLNRFFPGLEIVESFGGGVGQPITPRQKIRYVSDDHHLEVVGRAEREAWSEM